MSAIRLSNRYAKAIMDLAIERGSLEEVCNDVRMMSDTINQHRDLALLLKSPIVQADKKRNIINAVFGGSVNSMLMEFSEILVRKRREMYLGSICESFLSMYNDLKRVKKVKITSAVPLDEGMTQKISESLREEEGATVELETEVDPDLIGGYVIRYGDKEYDASVARNLNAMRAEFSKNTYVKKY